METLTPREDFEEYVFLSLRLAEGLDIAALKHFRPELGNALDAVFAAVDGLVARGLLEWRDRSVCVPFRHLLISDEIAVEIICR